MNVKEIIKDQLSTIHRSQGLKQLTEKFIPFMAEGSRSIHQPHLSFVNSWCHQPAKPRISDSRTLLTHQAGSQPLHKNPSKGNRWNMLKRESQISFPIWLISRWWGWAMRWCPRVRWGVLAARHGPLTTKTEIIRIGKKRSIRPMILPFWGSSETLFGIQIKFDSKSCFWFCHNPRRFGKKRVHQLFLNQ